MEFPSRESQISFTGIIGLPELLYDPHLRSTLTICHSLHGTVQQWLQIDL